MSCSKIIVLILSVFMSSQPAHCGPWKWIKKKWQARQARQEVQREPLLAQDEDNHDGAVFINGGYDGDSESGDVDILFEESPRVDPLTLESLAGVPEDERVFLRTNPEVFYHLRSIGYYLITHFGDDHIRGYTGALDPVAEVPMAAEDIEAIMQALGIPEEEFDLNWADSLVFHAQRIRQGERIATDLRMYLTNLENGGRLEEVQAGYAFYRAEAAREDTDFVARQRAEQKSAELAAEITAVLDQMEAIDMTFQYTELQLMLMGVDESRGLFNEKMRQYGFVLGENADAAA